jgi:hypothetical protein
MEECASASEPFWISSSIEMRKAAARPTSGRDLSSAKARSELGAGEFALGGVGFW